MNKKEFVAFIEKFYEQGVDLIIKKNEDYAADENPFKNFEYASLINVDPERAILVRISDKMSRISNLLDKEASVLDEKLEDTILDCCNYLAILAAKLESNKKS